jgi:hypothetical protein
MLKYSLGTLFLSIAIVSLGCAAVANFSEFWAEIIVTVTVAGLLIRSLTAIMGSRRVRSFAVGFVVFGWTYFLLTFAESVGIRELLLTHRAVNWLYLQRQNSSDGSVNEGIVISEGIRGGGSRPTYDGTDLSDLFLEHTTPFGNSKPLQAPPELHNIGHAIWTWLLALAGGVLAHILHRTRADTTVAE